MTQEHDSFIVLSPQPEFFPQGGVLAPRLDTLRGKTIAFLDNNKLQPHNRYFDLFRAYTAGARGRQGRSPCEETVLHPPCARRGAQTPHGPG
jgi:hypothetical protein